MGLRSGETRQEQDPCFLLGDGSGCPWAFVDVEIIPDHHVARLERRGELCAHISVELVAIHGAIDDKGSGYGIAAQPGDKGLGAPFAERRIRLKTLAFFAPAAQRRHVGFDRSLIDKDETAGALSHGRLAMVAPRHCKLNLSSG